MKIFITLAAVIAVAVAGPLQRGLVTPGAAGAAPVIVENPTPIAIGPAILDFSPISVGPALVESSPISVGPALVESSPISVGPAIIEENPIAVGPAFIDFPLPDGGVSAVEPIVVVPTPVLDTVSPVASQSAPVVQIILNINVADLESYTPITVSPVGVEQVVETVVPGPVNVVDSAITPEVVLEPIIAETVVPGPVNVVDSAITPDVVLEPIIVETVVPGPVNVVDSVVVEPVIVDTPIIPAPVVVLPELLN